MMIDRKKLAVIHIVKKELRLTEEEYRTVLEKVAGVKSAKDLTEPAFRRLMAFLVRHPRYRLNPFGLTLKQKLYIQYLARDMGWDENHLGNFLHKYYRKSRLEWLTRKEAMKVIESLKNVRLHQKKAA